MATTATRAPRTMESPEAPPVERRRAEERRGYRGRSGALVRGLGLFSIALGAAELVAPTTVSHLVGRKRTKSPAMIRLLGLREMVSGIGILSAREPAPWLWARVAGDAMDLALLGVSGRGRVDRGRLLASAAAVAGVTALDVFGARQSRTTGSSRGSVPRRIEVRKTITISRPPVEVYSFWRNLENLPRFMEHLDAVRIVDDRRSVWKAKGPAGSAYEWEAEITDDRPGELIAWHSPPPSDALNEGVVRFAPAPADQGTEVHVELRYESPAGPLGAAIAKLFGREPGQQVMGDLRRLKQVLETGEVMLSGAGKGALR